MEIDGRFYYALLALNELDRRGLREDMCWCSYFFRGGLTRAKGVRGHL